MSSSRISRRLPLHSLPTTPVILASSNPEQASQRAIFETTDGLHAHKLGPSTKDAAAAPLVCLSPKRNKQTNKHTYASQSLRLHTTNHPPISHTFSPFPISPQPPRPSHSHSHTHPSPLTPQPQPPSSPPTPSQNRNRQLTTAYPYPITPELNLSPHATTVHKLKLKLYSDYSRSRSK